jgi:hypothetical protein
VCRATALNNTNYANSAYNGAEIFVENFEVLTAKENKFTWEPQSNGTIAAGAVSTGREGNDELYIGRAPYQGSMTVGKVRLKVLRFVERSSLDEYLLFRFILHIDVFTFRSMAKK